MKYLAVGVCLLFSVILLIPHSSANSAQRTARQQYVDDQIVVKFKAGAALDPDSDLIAEEVFGSRGVRNERLTSNPRSQAIQLIHLNGMISVEDAVRRAKQDPRVEFAEPDYIVEAMDTVPNDTFFDQMWGLSNTGCLFCDPNQPGPDIEATKAWDLTTGSDDVVAVVLDTGVDLGHEDLADNAWVNPGEIAGNGIDDDGNGFVDDVHGWSFFDNTNKTFRDTGEDFHGTHVAGSIGAVGNNGKGVTGVAWHVKLMSLKFLGGPQGKGSTSNAVKGINYAIDMRNRGVNVRVINASWGGGSDSTALRQAISDANNAGILFVSAAGNSGNNIDEEPEFPAAYAPDFPNALSVAAIDSGGSLASFSNVGHHSVSLAAPGVSIWSTLPGSYGTLSGTSMSTPYVSGIAVLLWSREPQLTPAQVKQRIIDTSEPTSSVVSLVARSGRASAFNALTNRIPSAQHPEVIDVHFTKKTVTIDGFGFINGSSVVEVGGQPLPAADFDSSFALANGTLTQLTLNLGKKPLKKTFPAGVAVSIKVFNPTTGDRSPVFTTARF